MAEDFGELIKKANKTYLELTKVESDRLALRKKMIQQASEKKSLSGLEKNFDDLVYKEAKIKGEYNALQMKIGQQQLASAEKVFAQKKIDAGSPSAGTTVSVGGGPQQTQIVKQKQEEPSQQPTELEVAGVKVKLPSKAIPIKGIIVGLVIVGVIFYGLYLFREASAVFGIWAYLQ